MCLEAWWLAVIYCEAMNPRPRDTCSVYFLSVSPFLSYLREVCPARAAKSATLSFPCSDDIVTHFRLSRTSTRLVEQFSTPSNLSILLTTILDAVEISKLGV